MNAGPRSDLELSIEALKAAVTRAYRASGMPSVSPGERALIESELNVMRGSIARLEAVLTHRPSVEVSHVA